MRIIFIRHGDPDYKNDSLTKKGWREAELLSERVVKWKVDDFYCSPLGRAKDTAGCTLKKLGREAKEYEFLREFRGHVVNPSTGSDHICWDFMPEFWTVNEQLYDKDEWAKDEIMLKSSNCIEDEWKMVCNGIDGILANHGYVRNGRYYDVMPGTKKDSTIVLFCHFGVTSVMLGYLLGISPAVLLHGIFLPPTSVTIMNSEERILNKAYFRTQVIGDVTHLHTGGEMISDSGYFSKLLQEKF